MPTPLSSLVDEFADPAVDVTRWPLRAGTLIVVNNQLRMGSGASVGSATDYTLPGNEAFLRAHPSEGSTSRSEIVLDIVGTVKTGPKSAKFDSIRVLVNRLTGKLSWSRIEDLFNPRWAEALTYDATSHAWVKVREDGGSLFLETSPHGTAGSWTTQLIRPLPAGPLSTPGAVSLGVTAWWSGGTPTAPAWIDNLNVPA